MKQNLKDFLLNLVISMVIGLVVGMSHVFVINISRVNIEILIISSIVGGVIGSISRVVFIYIVEINRKKALVAYISVFIIIGAISCMPSLYFNYIYNDSISIIELASILIPAELFGIIFCYYSYKRYLEFNSKLLTKKKQLSRQFNNN